MDYTNVIIRPLVTEKSTHQQNTRNTYAFQVHPDASKPQIKAAVEHLYSVKVADVRTMNRKGKARRTKIGYSMRTDTKRALVELAEGSRIELF
ncbi:MAG TPA: 50S ribosomal protein L23 [Humisphaera sp.]